MKQRGIRSSIAVLVGMSFVAGSCGSDTSSEADALDQATTEADESAGGDDGVAVAGAAASEADETVPTIVVTTNILGDVVGEVVGDAADVITIMPVGADPHDFQPSAQEVDSMMNADALFVNGGDFEAGLLDVIENATDEGVPTFEVLSAVEEIEFGATDEEHADDDHSDDDHSDDDHADEEHADDDHADDDHADDDHDHSGVDPHFFTDPMRMAAAVEGIVGFLQSEAVLADPEALRSSADAYLAELTAVDGEVEGLVELIPAERRVMVTNHEVFGYFADRYGFEIVGVVVPGGSTTDNVSAAELAELADVIEAEGVPAIFSDASSSDQLVQTLAGEVGDIVVASLFTESLGDEDSEGATYLDMIRTNGQRISDALS